MRSFESRDTARRWIGLYAGKDGGRPPRGRWALFQRYAEKRARDRLDLCTGLIESYRSKKVLDVACGGGQYGKAVLEGGGEWVGFDLSHTMVRWAKDSLARPGARVAVIRGDIQDLPFAKSSFDVIFCVGILSYFPDEMVSSILSQLSGLLRQGGVLIVQTIRLDVLTWMRSRLPSWVPQPIRLPGPLYPRKASFIHQKIAGTRLRQKKTVGVKKYCVMPFQTVYCLEAVGGERNLRGGLNSRSRF